MSLAGFQSPRIFLYGILILLPCLVLWAAFAKVDRVIRVEGVMIPVGRSQKIQHFEGGILAGIFVREGDTVKKGDLLLAIDNTTAGANLTETKGRMNSQKAKIARLQAEVNEAQTLDFDDEAINTPIALAEIKLFETRKNSLDQSISVHENTIKQHMAGIKEAQDRSTQLQNELVTANERVAMMERMAKNQAASKLEVLDAQSRQQRLKTETSEVSGSVPKLKASIEEERLRIQAIRSDFRARTQDELVTALAEYERLNQTLLTAQDRLKRTEIKAPVSGVINSISVNTVGGVIKSGEDLIEMIPQADEILIEARAHPRDRGYLRPGLQANVRVSAYDASEFGLLTGKVTEVSADSLEGPHNESYYKVGIKVDVVPKSYKGHPMVPGMTVLSDVVTGNRTVLNYLLSPLRKFKYNMFKDPR